MQNEVGKEKGRKLKIISCWQWCRMGARGGELPPNNLEKNYNPLSNFKTVVSFKPQIHY